MRCNGTNGVTQRIHFFKRYTQFHFINSVIWQMHMLYHEYEWQIIYQDTGLFCSPNAPAGNCQQYIIQLYRWQIWQQSWMKCETHKSPKTKFNASESLLTSMNKNVENAYIIEDHVCYIRWKFPRNQSLTKMQIVVGTEVVLNSL